jgi:hypothetical protein
MEDWRTNMKQQRFHARGLTSFFVTAGFLVMALTGIVLYFQPEGRIAFWTHWTFLGLTKTQWGNVHIISSVLFIVAGAFHVYFNWKPLTNYILDKVRGGLKLKNELAVVSIASVIIVAGSIAEWPPFNYILDFSEYLKDAWVTKEEYEPPFGHAELMSMRSLARIKRIDLEKARQALGEKGYSVGSADDSLEKIAGRNNVSPMDIYQIMIQFQAEQEVPTAGEYTVEQVEETFAGSGVGRMTLPDVVAEAGVDPSKVQQRLEARGIEFNREDSLKEIAEESGLYPLDLLKIMLVEGYEPE